MTRPNGRRALRLSLLGALALAPLAGCASHATDAVAAPAGTKVGTPMTATQQQAANQMSAARAAKRNGGTP